MALTNVINRVTVGTTAGEVEVLVRETPERSPARRDRPLVPARHHQLDAVDTRTRPVVQ